MSDFKSTKEIYEYLIAGGQVICLASIPIYLINGQLNNSRDFNTPSDWSKHIPLKVKMWKWAYRTKSGNWVDTGAFYRHEHEVIKLIGNGTKFQRIESSMIEVEGE